MSKAPKNNMDFVAIARKMLQSSPDLAKGEEVSEDLVESMADQLEVKFINDQLKSKVQRLVPIKRTIAEVDQNQSSSKSIPKKIKTPTPKVKSKQTKSTSNHSEAINFFEEGWAEKPIGRRANTLLQSVRSNPNKWIKKMDHLYQLFAPDDSKYLLSLSAINFSLDQLLEAYVEVDPSSLYSVISSVAEGRRARGYHNWLAVAISFIINRQTAKGGSLADRLVEFQNGLKLPKERNKTIKSLAKHCLTTFTFYRALGDFVILSPDIFEKRFLLQYPEEEIKTLIKVKKRSLPTSIIKYRKFM